MLRPVPLLKNQIGNGLGIHLGQGDEFFSGGTLHGCSYEDSVLTFLKDLNSYLGVVDEIPLGAPQGEVDQTAPVTG